MTDRLKAGLLGLVLFVLFILGWQGAVSTGLIADLAPTPGGVWTRGVEILSDPFYREGPGSVGIFWHLLTSLQRVVVGFLIAAVIAIPLGFLLGRVQILRWAVDPLIQILRPVSPLAWLPIGLALLLDAERTAVFVIVLSALWPILINTIDAVLHIHPTYLKLTTTLGTPLWLAVTRVWLPATLPGIITGLRLSLSTSWLVIIAAEMLVGGQGIGFFVWNMWNRLDIDAIVVAIVLIGLTGLILDHLIGALQKTVRYD
ncbi:ABC transporter permease [Corynebacterium marinum]|uniref:Nitrate ABC superfamily ATP binding cassette transporter, permease protein n=2 Tax=Corynebacterium marinum TaxID=349751 RepID=A0A0B6TQY8_9CORY|nr:ABC transporter permease [Corynebacterium marinum]AJK68684.1 nitrate ABC superfamily ATP binding cassette transporter, permease protein [Corynebacterium marinum DSM 44953]NLF91458.1 ABC transporter permease [Corynebacterium marinum]GGO13999.1 nitrate ABC transporter, permease protein [Corynebacterium marinum]